MQPKPPSWDLLMRAVPFAICFDRELRIVHVGETLSRIAADVQVGKLLPDVLSISPASLGWKFDTLAGQAGHFLVLTTHDGHLRLRGSVQALPQPEYLWLMLAPVTGLVSYCAIMLVANLAFVSDSTWRRWMKIGD